MSLGEQKPNVKEDFDSIPTNINPLTHVPEKVLEYV
jgi:hypothetical protein